MVTPDKALNNHEVMGEFARYRGGIFHSFSLAYQIRGGGAMTAKQQNQEKRHLIRLGPPCYAVLLLVLFTRYRLPTVVPLLPVSCRIHLVLVRTYQERSAIQGLL